MRRRLVIANLVIVIALLAVLEIPLALVYSRHEHDALTGTVQRDASAIGALAGEILERPVNRDFAGLTRRYSSGAGAVIVIVGSDGTELTPAGILSADPRIQAAIRAARSGTSSIGESDGLLFAAQPLTRRGPSRGAVVVARSDESVDSRVRRFWILLGSLGVGVVGLSLAVSGWLGRWVIDPLRLLERHATNLGNGDLGVRADKNTGPPEVIALVEAFNDMADRLDHLVASQKRFVADASHQLRSPLTALRLRLETLDAARPETVTATREAALEETNRLTRLVDGLLSLARAEGRRPEREPIEVTAVVAERREAWAPLAAEHGVDLEVDPVATTPRRALIVPGDLEQILDNLIDNALEASPPGSAVTLCVATSRSEVQIHVVDEGAGMSDEERALAFAPFWRGSEHSSKGGTGLGLAIAAQLARASRGTIKLCRSAAGGVDATVSFPVGDRDEI